MTAMTWVLVAGFVLSIGIVGLGFAAFWPEWTPEDLAEEDVQEEARRQAAEAAVAEEEHWNSSVVSIQDFAPVGPTGDTFMWTMVTGQHRARHRAGNLEEHTRPLSRRDWDDTRDPPPAPPMHPR